MTEGFIVDEGAMMDLIPPTRAADAALHPAHEAMRDMFTQPEDALAGDASGITRKILAGGQALVIGFIGWDGSGKTLSACMMAYQYGEAGYNVLHNGCLKFGELVKLDMLIDLKYRDSVILIDEAHSAFDSRRAMTLLNVEASNFLTQRRKQNVHLLYTTHYPTLIDNRLYRQTNLTISCKTNDEGHNVHWFVTDDHGHHAPPGSRLAGLFYGAKRFWGMYDSGSTQPLHYNRIDSRMQAESRKMERVNSILAAIVAMAAQGQNEGTPLDIFQVLMKMGVTSFSADSIGRIISSMGFSPRRTKTRRLYDLEEIALSVTGDTRPKATVPYDLDINNSQEGHEDIDFSSDSASMDVEIADDENEIALPATFDDPADVDTADDLFKLIGGEGTDFDGFKDLWLDYGLPGHMLASEMRIRGFSLTDDEDLIVKDGEGL